jgi:hypothetical protein
MNLTICRLAAMLIVAAVFCCGVASAAARPPAGTQAEGLRAAVGKVEITPTRPAWMAGYGSNRRSKGAHDPLMARCMVLESGGVRIAIVSCDLLGLPRYYGMKIRSMVHSVQPDRLYIAATHTHSGPDTLGQWGPTITQSGLDKEWMQSTVDKIVRLVDETAAKLEPAAVRFANTTDVPRISKNIRVARILDTELGVMQVTAPDGGRVIGTLVNYACHPEILDNHLLSADFPHWLYDTVEKSTGAVCLYLNGAQGGMITADYDESTAPKGENWQAAETIGTGMGQTVLKIIQNADLVKSPAITTGHRVFSVPMENERFKALISLHVYPSDALHNGEITTEVNRITVGPAEFLTLPGEVLPNIGFFLKRNMTGHPRFLLGLCCDELGYILTPEDYGLQLYEYESSVSVGSHMGALMEQNLLALLASAGGHASKSAP